MNKFYGELSELKQAVENSNKSGEWSEKNGTPICHTFRAKTGEILNWWPQKGTLSFQGINTDSFKQILNSMLESTYESSPVVSANPMKIFIVHGHDSEARDQLELILMRLGLQPFILQNSDGGGNTIIEALEKNIYEDTSFGIVLMTPDDFGYPKSKGEADRKPRARQNVILEMGMIMAKLGRSKMAILIKGALEIPSDCEGILRIEFNGHVKEIVPKLAQRLQAAGFNIDSQRIASASA